MLKPFKKGELVKKLFERLGLRAPVEAEPVMMGSGRSLMGSIFDDLKKAIQERDEARAEAGRLKDVGVPTLLCCPVCLERHYDEGEWAAKPHRTHLCENCGHLWRPFPVATYGVRSFPPEGARPHMLTEMKGQVDAQQ